MSGKTEIVYEPDTDIDIEEFKLEPTDTDEDAIAGKEDIDPLNIDQESMRTNETVKKRKITKVDNKDVYACDQCEYTGSQSALIYHKKAKHEGTRYPCDQCEHTSSHLGNLRRHKESKHEGIRYPCDRCEYTSSHLGNLRTHKESKHEGIRYPCDRCEYTFSQLGNLRKHKESKHVGIRYRCDQCEYTGSQSALMHHKRSKHEGIRYRCDQCEYTTSLLGNLKQHKDSKHKSRRYLCDQCEYTGSYSALILHKRSNHEGVRYPSDYNIAEHTSQTVEHSGEKRKHSDITAPNATKPFLRLELSQVYCLLNIFSSYF